MLLNGGALASFSTEVEYTACESVILPYHDLLDPVDLLVKVARLVK